MRLDPGATTVTAFTYLNVQTCNGTGTSIAIDPSGSPWVLGSIETEGDNGAVPLVSPLLITGSGFITQFSPDLTHIKFSTYSDGAALVLDASGAPYVAGESLHNFGQFSYPPQTAFFAKIDPTPSPISIDSVVAAGTTSGSPLPNVSAGELIRLIGSGIGPATFTPGWLLARARSQRQSRASR